MVIAGTDAETGDDLLVARAEHEGALIPGKFVPSHGVTYVAWGGEEHAKGEYEVSLRQYNNKVNSCSTSEGLRLFVANISSFNVLNN